MGIASGYLMLKINLIFSGFIFAASFLELTFWGGGVKGDFSESGTFS